jgi:hypothetical protein
VVHLRYADLACIDEPPGFISAFWVNVVEDGHHEILVFTMDSAKVPWSSTLVWPYEVVKALRVVMVERKICYGACPESELP